MIVEHGLISFLQKFDEQPFLVKMGGKEYKIGEGEPTFTVKFNKSIPLSDLMTSTSIALGEAYMDGNLEIEGDLYEALDHFLGQMGKFSTDQNALKKLIFTSSSKKNQEKEVRSHYDIGNDFYKLWLDETMSYSCGYFKHEDDTLYQAQVNKVDYILEKLYLKEGMTLLDIGCGWGFLLIEAAKKYKVHGTGITLSEEQYKECQKRIKEEGLEDYVKVELMDYRDLPKLGEQFDRVVSVGMVTAMAEYDFHTMDIENLRLHYNRTLRCWRKNYLEHLDEVKKMFDERFIRMWDLYLAACAATFHNGIIDIHQILMTKGINNDLPMVRWY